MQVLLSVFVEDSPWVFLFLTVILGGGAAYMAGRALALTWRPYWQLILYMLLLGGGLRFLHFALFEVELLSVHYYLTDTLILIAMASLGFRLTRVGQMITQYNWLYERSGLFGWRERSSA